MGQERQDMAMESRASIIMMYVVWIRGISKPNLEEWIKLKRQSLPKETQ